MVGERRCRAVKENGEPCQAAPLLSGDYCLMHDPERTEDVAAGRQLAGQRRRREHTIAGAYNLEGLEDVRGLRRVLVITLTDLLALESTVPRNSALLSAVATGAKLVEVGDLEARVAALEAAAPPRPGASTKPGRPL